jgi:hypothetical protein
MMDQKARYSRARVIAQTVIKQVLEIKPSALDNAIIEAKKLTELIVAVAALAHAVDDLACVAGGENPEIVEIRSP